MLNITIHLVLNLRQVSKRLHQVRHILHITLSHLTTLLLYMMALVMIIVIHMSSTPLNGTHTNLNYSLSQRCNSLVQSSVSSWQLIHLDQLIIQYGLQGDKVLSHIIWLLGTLSSQTSKSLCLTHCSQILHHLKFYISLVSIKTIWSQQTTYQLVAHLECSCWDDGIWNKSFLEDHEQAQ